MRNRSFGEILDLVVLVGSSFVFCSFHGPDGPPEETATEILDRTAAQFHLEIVFKDLVIPVETSFGQITGADADFKAVTDYAKLFAKEFNVYPPSLIESAKLNRIVLCTGLAFAGQRRNAIPDFEHNTLYLEVQRGSDNPDYLRKVIHHEFFHIIDFRDDGILYGDERWASLNPPGFAYGSGGVNAQSMPTTSLLTKDYPGFLNHYSTTGVEEDKAEIFANLMVSPDVMRSWANTDKILAAKIQAMHDLLEEFCPELNGEFWSKAVPALQHGRTTGKQGG